MFSLGHSLLLEGVVRAVVQNSNVIFFLLRVVVDRHQFRLDSLNFVVMSILASWLRALIQEVESRVRRVSAGPCFRCCMVQRLCLQDNESYVIVPLNPSYTCQ